MGAFDDQSEPELLAALLSATLFSLKKERNRWGQAIGTRFPPMSHDQFIAVLAPRPNRSATQDVFRRLAVAALAAAKPRGARELALQLQRLRDLMTDEEWQRYSTSAAPCAYCRASWACQTTRRLEEGRQGNDGPHVQVMNHKPTDIDFDPETFVTSVSINNFKVRVPSRAAAVEVLQRLHPYNWATSFPALFTDSRPAKFVADEPEFEPRGWADDGDMFESARWAWSADSTAYANNILTITGLSKRRASGELGLDFRFALRRCCSTKFAVAWQSGGLDIDNGRVTVTSEVERDEKVLLTISAQKNIRYTVTDSDNSGLGTVLNLMAPALVSTFMRWLVYHSADGVGQLGYSMGTGFGILPPWLQFASGLSTPPQPATEVLPG
jgi:hypothetical protein